MENRPFFSIIVPCYNPRPYLKQLLESIVAQKMNDDIEVILSDDHSTQDYQDIVDEYKNQLNIKQILTDYNFAPGNTREKGVSIATGEWITFIDQDDLFVGETLPIVKQQIQTSGQKYHAIGNFLQTNADLSEVIKEFVQPRNWCHAKFYNLDNFWKKYNIHFKKDLKTHQDIYISGRVLNYLQLLNGDNPLRIDLNCYIWRAFPESISRRVYQGDRYFLENFFSDYMQSTGWNTIEMFENVQYSPEFTAWDDKFYFEITNLIDILLFCYFYLQGFIFNRPKDYLKENELIIANFYKKVKKITTFTKQDFIQTVSQNQAAWYNKVRPLAAIGVGDFVQQETFKEFLQRMENLKEQSE